MTVVQIRKNSEEKEVALKAPHASSKWSHAGSDDMVFNKAGEKDRLMSGVLDSPSRFDDIHDRLDSIVVTPMAGLEIILKIILVDHTNRQTTVNLLLRINNSKSVASYIII